MSHSRNSTQAPDSTGPELADTLLSDFLVDTEAMLRALQADGVSAAALTAAESRVLQFLPSRLTFQQIGKHLFLFQTTIKTHAQAIYRKLGTSSRDEAVARAQSLGLVESPPWTYLTARCCRCPGSSSRVRSCR